MYGASRFARCSSKNPTMAQLWDTFVQAWALVYIGMPNVVTTDRGTQFTSRYFELRSSITVSNSNTPPSSPTTHLEPTSALMRSYAVFISRRAMTIQNVHKNWLLCSPRRRSTKLSGWMESFQHCSCPVLCHDFGRQVLTPSFSLTLNVSAVRLLHELYTRGL
jgi:hypothetical protein